MIFNCSIFCVQYYLITEHKITRVKKSLFDGVSVAVHVDFFSVQKTKARSQLAAVFGLRAFHVDQTEVCLMRCRFYCQKDTLFNVDRHLLSLSQFFCVR